MKNTAVCITSWVVTGLVVGAGIYITNNPNMAWAFLLPTILNIVAITSNQ